MNTHDIQRINDFRGLQAVHQFGYLRATELGRFIWPTKTTSKKMAERLIRNWVKRRLVILRMLPNRAGHVAVLAAAGTRLLAEMGVQATTGKSIGKIVDCKWQPPATWRHDLISAGVLTMLSARGWRIVPENEVRRLAGRMTKLPDGLACDPEGRWWWLEVENARKSGPAMRQLCDVLYALNDKAISILGLSITGALVAYTQNTDEIGHRINHRRRIYSALESRARKNISLTFVNCHREREGISSINFEPTIISPARQAHILKALAANGWKIDEEGIHSSIYAGFLAEVWPEDGELWGYQVTYMNVPGMANYAGNITEAKFRTAELIANY